MVFIWYLHRTQNEGTSAFEPLFLENGFVIYSRKNDFLVFFFVVLDFLFTFAENRDYD